MPAMKMGKLKDSQQQYMNDYKNKSFTIPIPVQMYVRPLRN